MGDRPHWTAAQMAHAIRTSRGILAAAARSLGCERETVVNYCKRYPTVQAAYDEQREVLVDIAESQLIKQVDAGTEWGVKWVLATLGKDRGYVTRQENTGKDGAAIVHEVEHHGGVDVRAIDYRQSVRLLAAPKDEPGNEEPAA